MAELKIESGIPLPDARVKGATALLRQLAVGDSVLFPTEQQNSISNKAQYALGKGNYAVRKVEGGYRVWRTK